MEPVEFDIETRGFPEEQTPQSSEETVGTVIYEAAEPIDYTPLINEGVSSICNVVLFAGLAICGMLFARYLLGGVKR